MKKIFGLNVSSNKEIEEKVKEELVEMYVLLKEAREELLKKNSINHDLFHRITIKLTVMEGRYPSLRNIP